jgi:hypothetical protein
VTDLEVDDEPRTVSGWKATIAAITLIVVVFSLLNVLARGDDGGSKGTPRPSPSVVSVSPDETG